MGAFLRQLPQHDSRFASRQVMQGLRHGLARIFLKVLAEGTPVSTKIHLCLSFQAEEAQCNADVFLRALIQPCTIMEGLRHRLTVYPDADALELAHVLAAASPEKVVLVNAANRKNIGNHWFGDGAERAIDENLHRRSWKMSAIAYLLNGWAGYRRHRARDELQRNVEWLNGRVHTIEQLNSQV